VAERAAEQARRAQEDYERHLEAKRETKRLTDERRAEAERVAAEAAEVKERQRVAEEQRRAALRKPLDDDNSRSVTIKDWPLFS